jgi:uncharacterized Zn-binding protein involved in type VI secretion
MIDLVRLGDTTDHGGEVVTASQTMRYQSVSVARGEVPAAPRGAAEPDPPRRFEDH